MSRQSKTRLGQSGLSVSRSGFGGIPIQRLDELPKAVGQRLASIFKRMR